MRLTYIFSNSEIMENLRWDLTQEMLDAPGPLRFHPLNDKDGAERIRKEHKEQAGYYFCIHAWNDKARLALIHFLPVGDMKVVDISGFPEKFLIEAIQQSSESTINKSIEDMTIQHAEDKIHVGGHFIINKPIEDMLRLRLMVARKGSQ
jgi:D-hexose-6-phosphate mutarotase